MSTISYLNNQLPILIVSLTYLLTWVFFILNRDSHTIKNYDQKSVWVKESTPLCGSNEVSFSRIVFIMLLLFTLVLSNLRFVSGFILFEQLIISSFSRDMFLIICLFYVVLQFITYSIYFYKVVLPLEYLYSLALFFVISPLLYLSSSLYSFFFLLEVLGVLVVLLFSSLTYSSTKKSATLAYESTVINPAPTKLIVSLFTQFWISFFSTILLILFLMLSLFMWNTSLYFELDTIITASCNNSGSYHSIFVIVWDFLFLFGFFLKSGIAPLHLFKIEVYRGLPFFTVFMYTFLYFLSFFLYFMYVIYWLLPHMLYYNLYILEVFVLYAVMYLSASLFASKHIKTFLALSSILNSLVLFAAVLPLTI